MRTLLLLLVLCLIPACSGYAETPAAPVKEQKTDVPKTKTQLIEEETAELKAQYELILQKQKNKIAELEAGYNRLELENKFSSEKYTNELNRLRADLNKAITENQLADERFRTGSAPQNSELQKLALDNRLADERFRAGSAPQNAELQKLALENRLADETAKKKLAEISIRLAGLKLENDLQAEVQRKQDMAEVREKNAVELELKKLDLKERQLKLDKLVMESRMNKLDSDLAMRAKKEDWKKEANTDPVYAPQPFSDGRLVISDRRIAMNGPIFTGMADYVTDRIHYFNNISSAPIFLVIDNSPGGSVMAGYRILKAMQASRAPVAVVVKSFAASMAAVITTLAEKSYVYPNAIILHHQMSTMNWGNMTQLKEQLEMAREWERRLAAPVAKKMGLGLEDFRKKMYEKNSDGDWEEFGDKAVGYNWATSVVDRIEETGLVKNPDYESASARNLLQVEQTDEKGRRYVTLPRLQPFDFYFIHNPDSYYR